ncbi:hypothetical protein GCM10009623_34620 [Nocardioides aestuarii]
MRHGRDRGSEDGGDHAGRLLLEVDQGGRVVYWHRGRREDWAHGESLAVCCARLAVEEVVLPATAVWPRAVVDLVVGLTHVPLPSTVKAVAVADRRWDLRDPVRAAAWGFVVAAVVARRQAQ